MTKEQSQQKTIELLDQLIWALEEYDRLWTEAIFELEEKLQCRQRSLIYP